MGHGTTLTTPIMLPELDDEEEVFTCWCGVENPYFSDEDLDDTCGGAGELYCYCGGDLCVCHNHGSSDCPGCPDCEDEGDDGYDDFDLSEGY